MFCVKSCSNTAVWCPVCECVCTEFDSLLSIQSEDKTFSPVSDVGGPLLVLEHVVQHGYFPKLAKDMLVMFLSQ